MVEAQQFALWSGEFIDRSGIHVVGDGSGGGGEVHMMVGKKDTWTNLVRFQNSYHSPAMEPESLLVFVNANK